MPRRSKTRPKRVLLMVALALMAILAMYDLFSPHSVLASFWNRIAHSPTRGEQMRDNILEQLPVRR